MPYTLRYDVPPTGQETPMPSDDVIDQQPNDQTQPPQRIKTIYVTMSTKDPQRHIHWREVGNVVIACMAIAMLMALVVSPNAATYTTKTLVVPAILLPVRVITVSVPITPTGVKTYLAIQAQGTLTITNGGSLPQFIQAGFLLTSYSGVEVSTDYGVTVPEGNGESYGVATVSAHVVVAGSGGNIPAYSIKRTYGTDIFIKNLSAFTGGQDAYSVQL
ncbi:MAG TPA: hypothetical protein VFN35_16190 [Ktedonobacteraceae bacterium]|nr:hypothetical protein [Ktedonobacteraceae bacterium]